MQIVSGTDLSCSNIQQCTLHSIRRVVVVAVPIAMFGNNTMSA